MAFCRKKTPFIDQKCTYEKIPKKLGMPPPPPPHLDKIQKNSSFFSWRLPLDNRLVGAVNVEVDVGVDVDHLTAQLEQVIGVLVQAALPLKLKLMLVLILTSKLE